MASEKIRGFVPFFVSFGGENFFLDRDLTKARAWPGRHLVEVDGTEITDVELVSICETRSMDDQGRIVVVDAANKVKGDKALKAYIADKDPKDEATILVAILRSEKISEVWTAAAKKGKVYEHKKLKTFESNNEVVKWVEIEARRLGLTLDTGVSELLFQLVGADLYRLAGELRKLSVFVRDEKVKPTHLKLVVSPSPSAEPYQVVEAALNRDPKKAMNLLSTVYKNMGEDANVLLSNALMRQVERLLVVRSLLDRRTSPDDIAGALGMHPFRFKTAVLPQANKYTTQELVRLMGRLCRLDADVKGPARSKRTQVELVVLEVTG